MGSFEPVTLSPESIQARPLAIWWKREFGEKQILLLQAREAWSWHLLSHLMADYLSKKQQQYFIRK